MLFIFYGGTFDPIHYGHLSLIKYLLNSIYYSKILIIPNNIPPHRSKTFANSEQRLFMLNLALNELKNIDKKRIFIDKTEINSKNVSYTVRTLYKLKNKYKINSSPCALVVGQDVILKINTWYNSSEILNICHLLVFKRYKKFNFFNFKNLRNSITKDINLIYSKNRGKIYFFNNPVVKISSSKIRKRYRLGKSCSKLVPKDVDIYINKSNLYR
ncbi:MAG: nicotinate (nicotinamide) nucleotide adenylyltransferase [Enterobacteriaceae bacterium]